MKSLKNYISATFLVAILLFLITLLLGYHSHQTSDIYNQIKLIILFALPYIQLYIDYLPLAVGLTILVSAIVIVLIGTIIKKLLRK